jgi:dTDP-4-dehydrorhamnose reductase
LPDLRLACIGRSGQTARSLAAAVAGDASIDFVQAGSEGANLRDPASLAAFLDRTRPDVVINTGAYNFVDKAESEPDEAMLVNAEGPRALARRCRALGVPFIHMSTDFVFDGLKASAYTEEDEALPLSAYGRSKLAGERAVAEEYPDAVTARVAWVFSEHGDNFVSKVIGWARTQPSLKVVNDQVGPPTYAPDIAAALIKLARKKLESARDLAGPLNVVSPDIMNRWEMATAILAESRAQGGPFAEVEPVSTAAFNAPAKRPRNSRLSNAKAVERLDLGFTPFQEALRRSVAGVLARV